MKRNPDNLESRTFDLLIIGGGISGAAVAHDAVLRGLSVAMVEKNDFGWATSAATSKLIHGGLRYLKNLEFGLVRESLQERRTFEIIAPHLVYPFPFLIPTYEGSSNSRILIYPGMFLYDILSYDKGSLEDPDRKVPHFKILTKSQVLAKEPNVNQKDLTGGAIYYDCQMYSSERTTLEFVLSAARNGAQVSNYMKVESLIVESGCVRGAKAVDLINGQSRTIRADVTVNVSGPWADFVSGMGGTDSQTKIVRSEGIHIITRQLVENHAVVYRTRSGRHFFIIPWRGKSLIGTTDTRYDGSPDDYGVKEKNVLDFIDEINEAHPAAQLTLDDVQYSYGGLRPIVEDETEVEVDVYDKSRRYEIYDHAEKDNLLNFLTVVGGKYTTSRALAEKLVERVLEKLGKPPAPCITEKTPLFGGSIKNWESFINQSKLRFPDIPEPTLNNLVHSYGSAYEKVLGYLETDPELSKPISGDSPTMQAQIAYAVDEEMAVDLTDALCRRTDMAALGQMTKAEVEQCAGLMGRALNWSDKIKKEQISKTWDILLEKGIRYR